MNAPTVELVGATICDVIRRWAEIQPDAPAILAKDRPPLSYSMFIGRIDRVREVLKCSGLGRGDRIAIVHGRSDELSVLIFGVMSGATAVPLNPKLTAAEFHNQLRSCKAKAVVVEDRHRGAVADAAARLEIPCFDASAFGHCPAGDTGGAPLTSTLSKPDDVAIVYGTSGTTSRPKIIPICHRNLMLRMAKSFEWIAIGADDRFFTLRPLYYAGGHTNLCRALFSGGSVFFFDQESKNVSARDLVDSEATWMSAPPTVYRAILSAEVGSDGPYRNHKLRFLRNSSSGLDAKTQKSIEELFGVPLLQAYSMTETCWIAANPPNFAGRKFGSVGLPVIDEIKIMGADGRTVAPGERGEVFVRGPTVFEGYEGDPEANRAAFLDGWFRTGDEGFFDEDGYLVLTGRIKEMIDRGGEKVSPAEVDAAVMEHPGVVEAATFPIPHPTLGEEVAVAVVQAPGAALSTRVLSDFLLERLAGFKVPRLFAFVDVIPKSETGKLQRAKLADALKINADAGPPAAEWVERQATPLEVQLRTIWTKTLRRDRPVGLDDNFFLLGGDSLQAVEMFLDVERALKMRLPAAALFEAGTVAEMAQLIEQSAVPGCIVPIQPQGSRPPFFCVHGNAGEVIGFHHLSRHLGQDQPFFAIQSIGWNGETVPFTCSEDMAAHYIAAIRRIQPEGPYYIGGYSFGGRIACYMARALKAAGEEVALLALIDTTNYVGRMHASLDEWLERQGANKGARRGLQTLRYGWFRTRKLCDAGYARVRRAILFRIWDHYRKSGKTLPRFLRRPGSANRLVRLEHATMPPYDGDAVYFRAESGGRLKDAPDVRDCWDRVIKGRLEVRPIPGNHATIIQGAHAAFLARELAESIDRALASAGPVRRKGSPGFSDAAAEKNGGRGWD
ncbi:MAG: non-ribosomal peptide synthetase [Hyphomicrobiales bacterium]|nr:non-ribosomal peptide synthetase [Hyphomicrobiales bacterium]